MTPRMTAHARRGRPVTTGTTPSRQERALAWRRDHVLDCAERIFAHRGFHDATMQEIAAAAEYATGTMYTLFESKEDLFAAVVRRRLPELDAHLRAAAATGVSPREQTANLVRAFFEFFEARKPLFRIYVNATGGFLWNVKAELGDEVAARHQALLAFLEGIIQNGIRQGDIRRDLDPRLTAVALIGILVAVATDHISAHPEQPFEPCRHRTLQLLMTLLEPTVGRAAPRRRTGRPAPRRPGR